MTTGPTARPAGAPDEAARVLDVADLRTRIRLSAGTIDAVNGVSFHLSRAETFAVVGESGCGKTMMALSIMRLLPPAAVTTGGSIDFEGVDLLQLDIRAMRRVRGKAIGMIFQEPMSSLNPLKPIGGQIAEVLTLHEGLSRRAALERAVDMLQLVRIPEPRRRLFDYPHQLSGGMRQRVMIAIALACNPRILIADEPTTALDVTIQAQIMALIADLQERLGTAVMLITHDLGVVAEHAERIMVMYAGSKVEEAEVDELFDHPCHPYTLGLLGSVPRLGTSLACGARRRLTEVPGSVPSLLHLPAGCSFADRCSFASPLCREAFPPLEEKRPGHVAACWHSDRVLEATR